MASGPASAEVAKVAREFVAFLNKAVTPYHAVEESAQRLMAAGFQELREGDAWKIEPSKKYFVTKNRTAILAFAVGSKFRPGNGYSIVAGHTDSPSLRVKPISKLCSEKFLQVGVSTYGGGIWRTWFDRDLSIAGQVIYKKEGTLVHKLVNVAKPVLFIPNLAIHFSSPAERNKFECNTEKELRPIIATLAAEKLNKCKETAACEGEEVGGIPLDPRSVKKEHNAVLLEMIAAEAECGADDIVDLDLYLYDHQGAVIGGIREEFISSQRLDNLVGTYTTITSLIESVAAQDALTNEPNVRMAVCYDNEECGSESAQGAASHFTEWVMRRLAAGGSATAFEEAIGKSFLISGDNAHASHPNYKEKHEDNHRPEFHGGVVVKINTNQRYATTSTTHAVLKEVAHRTNSPLQKFVVRNDVPCGTTVGPILASRLGLQTVDVGCAQLAMHSIREFICTSSISQAINLYSGFYKLLPEVLESLK